MKSLVTTYATELLENNSKAYSANKQLQPLSPHIISNPPRN
jgi:hypothetical protein